MAGFGAHVTSNLSINKPSIFEVLAQETLSSGLRSAFFYLSNVLVESDPSRYLWLRSHFDEAYLLFDILVQSTHLKAYNASFAEKFYGLERVSSNGRRLSSQELFSSLFLLTAFPYIKRKLDMLYANLRRMQAENSIQRNSKAHYFVKTYPALALGYESFNLIHQIRYAVGRDRYHSLLLRLASLELQTFVKLEGQSPETKSQQWTTWLFAKWVARGLGTGLSVGAFFLQFLDFFYTREDATLQLSRLPIPPPPAVEQKSPNASRNKCLLCNDSRRNETALSTSGYVFCYACIRGFVARNHKCPITGFPSSLDNLVRLYPPEH